MEEEKSLKEVILQIQSTISFLLSKWLIILIFGLLGGAIGLWMAVSDEPVYESKLKFMVDEGSQSGGLVSIARDFGLVSGGESASLFSSSNLIEFLQTRNMVEKALLQSINEEKYLTKTYAELYLEESGMRKEMQKKPALQSIHFQAGEDRKTFSREKDSILKKIYIDFAKQGLLTATQPNKDNSYIVINCTFGNEVLAKNFPGELLSVASEYYIDSKTSKTRNNVELLQHQVDSVKQELYASMAGAAISEDRIFGLNPAMNIERVPATRQRSKAEVSITVLKELIKNLEISKMKLLNKTPVFTIVDEPRYPLKKEKLGIIKGIALGGIIAGILIVGFLLARRYYYQVMAGE